MNSSDLRANAREKLAGKWGKAALIVLCYSIIVCILQSILSAVEEQAALSLILSIVVAAIEVPLGFGITISFMNIFKGEDVKVTDFITSGFNNFARAWKVAGHTILKMLLPFVLIVVGIIVTSLGAVSVSGNGSPALAGIGSLILIVASIWGTIKGFSYYIAPIVAVDNENLSEKEAVEKSEELMDGHRWQLFCLILSFIGWYILAIITCGIGFLWLAGYIQISMICFYNYLNNPSNAAPVKEETPTDAE